MSPIELLREGILQGDWRRVCEGFGALTGMSLEPAETPGQREIYRRLLLRMRFQIEEVLDQESQVEEPDGPLEPEEPEEDEPAARPPEADPKPPAERPSSPQAVAPDDPFRVESKPPVREDGKREATPLPLDMETKQLWKDDGSLAQKEIKDSKKFSRTKTPEPRRPRAKRIPVICARCGLKEEVEPVFVPRNLDPRGEDRSTYVCNRCIGKRPRS